MQNNPTPRPAYVVFHNDLKSEPTFTYFFNDNLLTARKAAITQAEKLFDGATLDNPGEEVEVYLVEATGPNDQAPNRIAQILQKGVSIASQVKPKPAPTLPGFENKHVPFLNWRHRAMVELELEHAYYMRHKLPRGLGCFVIWFQLHPEIPRDSVTILYDAAPYALALIYLLNEGAGLISCTYVEETFQLVCVDSMATE